MVKFLSPNPIVDSGMLYYHFKENGDYRVSIHARDGLDLKIHLDADEGITANLRVYVVAEENSSLDLELLAKITDVPNAHLKFDVFVYDEGANKIVIKPFLQLHEPSSTADHGVAYINLDDNLTNYLQNLGLSKNEIKSIIKSTYLGSTINEV